MEGGICSKEHCLPFSVSGETGVKKDLRVYITPMPRDLCFDSTLFNTKESHRKTTDFKCFIFLQVLMNACGGKPGWVAGVRMANLEWWCDTSDIDEKSQMRHQRDNVTQAY